MSGATMVPENRTGSENKTVPEQQPVRERQQKVSVEESRREANVNRSVRDIIASARRSHEGRRFQTGSLGAWSMSLLSAALLWACFTPVNASPLAWVALVPLLLLVRVEQRVRWMYTAVYGGSLLGQLATLQWMRLGDPTMYVAWAALAGYVALYAVAFVAVSRVAVHRWRMPLAVAGLSSGRVSNSCVLT